MPLADQSLTAVLQAALPGHRDAVLQAPTGAGKSTLIPLALLDGAPLANERILMLEPRRLAARAVAARMATLRGESIGDTVGYRMRLDTRVSSATRIEVITEGVLTRLLQEDPTLEGVAWLIFDEYHERSLQADVGLALALDARRQLGASFRILIMSATLEVERVAELLAEPAVVRVPARPFPVAIRYLGRGLPLLPGDATRQTGPGPARWPLESGIVRALQQALEETGGDVLAFLPGVGEIQRVQELLGDAGLPPQVRVLPLHGQLPPQAQDAVLEPARPATRKVILATNVAETSVTVPGVTAVVDSGLVRRSRFDPTTGMNRLELMRIARSSADQRAGRAGRVAPGICYRLWGETAQRELMAQTPAEILDADLAPLVLELARWGSPDVSELRWLDPPPAAALAQALELLERLGAVDTVGRINAMGQQMARLPVHPRLAHMLVLARAAGVLAAAAPLAALLSEQDLLRSPKRDPDLRTRFDLLQSGSGGPAAGRIRAAARSIESAFRGAPAQVSAGALPSLLAALRSVATPERHDELIGALLALAFPDRIGQRRAGLQARYLLSNGRGASFRTPSSLAREALIVAVELDDQDREARIDLAAPLSLALFEQLYAQQTECTQRCVWAEELEAVQLLEVRRFGALTLSERRLPLADDQRALPIVIDLLQRRGLGALPWDPEARTLQRRMELVRALARRDLSDWPASDDATLGATLGQWLAPYLAGVTRRDGLAQVPLRQALYARLTAGQQRMLEKLVPRELVLQSGKHARIDYLDEQAPSVSVRLQDAFGWTQTPTVAEGQLPLTLKLLSPAGRPVQITRDLAGFWRGGYAEVRKELRGRYPKHAWPENPFESVARPGVRGR